MDSDILFLTRDELIVFLQIIGAGTMNGLSAEPLAGVSEQERIERLSGGEQSLINRALLIPESDDSFSFDPMILALAGGAVIPSSVLVVVVAEPNSRPETYYFSVTPDLMIFHTEARPGVFAFEHLATVEHARERLRTLLAAIHGLPQATDGDVRFELQTFREVVRLVRQEGDLSGAATVLRGDLYRGSSQENFVRELPSATVWSGMYLWGLDREEETEGKSTVVFASTNGCWAVDEQHSQGDRVLLTSVTGSKAEEGFLALFDMMATTVVAG